MNRKQTPDWLTNLMAIVLIAMVLLLVAWLIGRFVPGVDVAILAFIEAKWPSLAKFLREQGWAPSILIAVVMALIAAWIGFRKAMKAGASLVYRGLRYGIHRLRTPTPLPAGCAPLSDIRRKLFPEEDSSEQPLELLGRSDELDWLTCQVRVAQAAGSCPVRVLLLWGPQGIGKTHLLFRFATGLVRREFRECGRWNAWSLDREFDPKALAETLPNTSTLLLWDDVSLNDRTRSRLRALLRECADRKRPLVVALSSWGPRGGLTRDQSLVDAELPVKPLDLLSATRLYACAADLPETERGHPLLLRLLSLQTPVTDSASMPGNLWDSCQLWASDFAKRLKSKYGLSSTACQALAVVSSSEACTWPEVQAAFGICEAEGRSLENTGLIRTRQGAVWLEPVRPDLLGWAYALHALAMIQPQDAERWAIHAWKSGFFDAERFVRFAIANDQKSHLWVHALRAPQLKDAEAALSRIAATRNSAHEFARTRQWEPLSAELSIAQEISVRFPHDIEIQVERAAVAAIAFRSVMAPENHFDWSSELLVARAIASRFPESSEVQVMLGYAVVYGIGFHGAFKRWDEMESELSVMQKMALKFPERLDIQYLRVYAASTAVQYYGISKQLHKMEMELNVASEISSRFPEQVEMQLAQAGAACGAVFHYGAAGRRDDSVACLAIVQRIAVRFPLNLEIQQVLANAMDHNDDFA